jgi:tRNA pseudouridine-54 N-methylase
MREFIYFSTIAKTTGNIKDITTGRLDIVCHFIIHSLFVSNSIRANVRVHLFFYGPPDPVKHLEIGPNAPISKKDLFNLIKGMLFKYKKGKRFEAYKDCFVEKKGLLEYMKENPGNYYVLDEKGESAKNAFLKESSNPKIILGDHKGLPKKEKKRMKTLAKFVSLGKITYFASQTVNIVNYELDNIEFNR